MGEIIKSAKVALAQASEEFVAVQTMGGRMHVRWDHGAQVTPHGQIVYFAEFLATAGIFDNWVKSPLRYTSPNASSVRDVLGTLMLGIPVWLQALRPLGGHPGRPSGRTGTGPEQSSQPRQRAPGIERHGCQCRTVMDAPSAQGQRDGGT